MRSYRLGGLGSLGPIQGWPGEDSLVVKETHSKSKDSWQDMLQAKYDIRWLGKDVKCNISEGSVFLHKLPFFFFLKHHNSIKITCGGCDILTLSKSHVKDGIPWHYQNHMWRMWYHDSIKITCKGRMWFEGLYRTLVNPAVEIVSQHIVLGKAVSWLGGGEEISTLQNDMC